MNHVQITLEGPVMENLCRVTIEDEYASSTFHADHADVLEARSEGASSVMALVIENSDGAGIDILNAAVTNESPVALDGEDFGLDDLGPLLKQPSATL